MLRFPNHGVFVSLFKRFLQLPQDLCHFFATNVLKCDVTTVLRGGPVVPRVARVVAHDYGCGPWPLMPEEPRFAPGLKNLKELAR